MKIDFPSRQFDDAIAAVCHGDLTEDQSAALNELLRSNPAARDEYILRLELHSRLASDPDLFGSMQADAPAAGMAARAVPMMEDRLPGNLRPGARVKAWAAAFAACVALIAVGVWTVKRSPTVDQAVTTSQAVAMLNRTVSAEWQNPEEAPKLNAPLEPSLLQLESGLAEIVFYSGARLILEGPAELQLISASQAFCRAGRINAEMPPAARQFRVDTPHATVTDMGSSFGLDVSERRTELHVFNGDVNLRTGGEDRILTAGSGALVEASEHPRSITADRAQFASMFDLNAKSRAVEAIRFDQWKTASELLNANPALLLRFDLTGTNSLTWQLRNTCKQQFRAADATIIGCQWVEGRWPGKRALEFQSVNDRVRVNVPGAFDAFTLTAWVRVQGLDRKLNSLFMSDGFLPGTIHWLIRRDGVLGLTVIGREPRNHQIVASPPVISLDKFGMWLHVAAVLDEQSGRVIHYLNGKAVSEESLRIPGPFHFGEAELGNWNSKGFPKDEPFMIRNFSGAIDEFCLFTRALEPAEIRTLYGEGKPERTAVASQ